MRKFVLFIACLAPLTGCASFQTFLERDEAKVDAWRNGEVEAGSVCVVVGGECRYVPADAYAEEGEAIEAAAHSADKEWRRSRPLAADEFGAR